MTQRRRIPLKTLWIKAFKTLSHLRWSLLKLWLVGGLIPHIVFYYRGLSAERSLLEGTWQDMAQGGHLEFRPLVFLEQFQGGLWMVLIHSILPYGFGVLSLLIWIDMCRQHFEARPPLMGWLQVRKILKFGFLLPAIYLGMVWASWPLLFGPAPMLAVATALVFFASVLRICESRNFWQALKSSLTLKHGAQVPAGKWALFAQHIFSAMLMSLLLSVIWWLQDLGYAWHQNLLASSDEAKMVMTVFLSSFFQSLTLLAFMAFSCLQVTTKYWFDANALMQPFRGVKA